MEKRRSPWAEGECEGFMRELDAAQRATAARAPTPRDPLPGSRGIARQAPRRRLDRLADRLRAGWVGIALRNQPA